MGKREVETDAKRQKSDASKKKTASKAKAGAAGSSSPKGRKFTVSLAVGASCIENAQNLELATLLAGQISRAAAIFNIDEVIVIDDSPTQKIDGHVSAAAALFARVLQFMETPQYLRKALIPMHKDLKFAGMLPPLDAPHHMRSTEWVTYREGVIKRSVDGVGAFIDVGLDMDAFVASDIEQGVRVTVKMGEKAKHVVQHGQQVYEGELVHPGQPREEEGLYWGYVTRIAPTLQSLFEECPFEGGYDLTVGTSERGEQVTSCGLKFSAYDHLLVVFGGPEGLEACLQHDPWKTKHSEPGSMFDRYLNTCSDQGSRTIRTEEAILISMSFLQPAIHSANA